MVCVMGLDMTRIDTMYEMMGIKLSIELDIIVSIKMSGIIQTFSDQASNNDVF